MFTIMVFQLKKILGSFVLIETKKFFRYETVAKYRLYYSHKKGANCMQIIPIRDLKNTVEVERRCAEENGPVFTTKNGYGRLVVMDIDYYEKTMRKMDEAKSILDGLEDAKSGNTVDGDTAISNIRSKYGI